MTGLRVSPNSLTVKNQLNETLFDASRQYPIVLHQTAMSWPSVWIELPVFDGNLPGLTYAWFHEEDYQILTKGVHYSETPDFLVLDIHTTGKSGDFSGTITGSTVIAEASGSLSDRNYSTASYLDQWVHGGTLAMITLSVYVSQHSGHTFLRFTYATGDYVTTGTSSPYAASKAGTDILRQQTNYHSNLGGGWTLRRLNVAIPRLDIIVGKFTGG